MSDVSEPKYPQPSKQERTNRAVWRVPHAAADLHQTALTCQRVIHVKPKALDLLHGQASIDKHSGKGEQCWVKQCTAYF